MCVPHLNNLQVHLLNFPSTAFGILILLLHNEPQMVEMIQLLFYPVEQKLCLNNLLPVLSINNLNTIYEYQFLLLQIVITDFK